MCSNVGFLPAAAIERQQLQNNEPVSREIATGKVTFREGEAEKRREEQKSGIKNVRQEARKRRQ